METSHTTARAASTCGASCKGGQAPRYESSFYDGPKPRARDHRAGILVARHLKDPQDLFDARPSPRTEAPTVLNIRLKSPDYINQNRRLRSGLRR